MMDLSPDSRRFKASPDLRVQLARVMTRHAGPWGAEELAILHRLLRDPEGSVWEEACRAVGSRATAEPGALEELQQLLGSGSAELRLRGVWAMATLDRERQTDVAQFLVERLSEPVTLEDAVLLSGLLRLAASLPKDLGEGVLVFCMQDPREDIRAAAAASLPDWDPWPRLLLLCADDPSPVVRAALAVSLRFLPPCDEVDGVLGALAADPHPMVSYAVTEALPVEEDEPGPYEFEPFESDEALLHRAREVEDSLGHDPGGWRSLLDRLLAEPDGLEVLAVVAETGREPGVRDLSRALIWLGVDNEDSLAGAAGALQGEGGTACPALATYLALCMRAAAALTLDDVAEWADLVRPASVEDLSADAVLGLEDLQDVATRMVEGQDVDATLAVLEDLEATVADWPRAERIGMAPVLAAWLELLSAMPDTESEETP